MDRILFNDLAKQWDDIAEICMPKVVSLLESGQYVSGVRVGEFENQFAQFTGASDCVALNNGTSALYAALLALNIGVGDRVIVQNNTFIATATSVLMVGATPILVDVDHQSGQLTSESIESVLKSGDVAAVIVVHLWGHAANILQISEICKNYGVKLIEDCAQAHGTTVLGKHVGTFGDVGCFSFYPGKSLGAVGEGGAIVTSQVDVAASVRSIRNWGQKERYKHSTFGINLRMDELQALVLSDKLRRLSSWTDAKNSIVRRYKEILPKSWMFANEFENEIRGYHLFVVKVDNRNAAIDALQTKEIPFGIHYPIALSNQLYLQNRFEKVGSYHSSLNLAEKIISLPLHPWVTEEQVTFISKTLMDSQQV